MPGLVGFSTSSLQRDALPVLSAMLAEVTRYKQRVTTSDIADCCAVGLSNLPDALASRCKAENERATVWLEGEIFPASVSGEIEGAGRILSLYSSQGLDGLKTLDGYYAGVIQDKTSREIHLVCDRYGFRHLYWTIVDKALVWSGELKALLRYPGFAPAIDEAAMDQFIWGEYILDDRTWFKNVSLLPAAGILTWNPGLSAHTLQTYWSPYSIRPLEHYDEREVIEELGKQLLRSVERRCGASERMGVCLSGGLDSRTVFAAAQRGRSNPVALTFGTKDALDVQIARQVAAVRRTKHIIYELTAANWLDLRAETIWAIDGGSSLLHMHAIPSYLQLAEQADVNLSGFVGDALFGGLYLGDSRSELTLLNNRARRFIIHGERALGNFVTTRFPFADNELATALLSIAQDIRQSSALYKKVLLHCFPEYFLEIPWQKTGTPIGSRPTLITKVAGLARASSAPLLQVFHARLPIRRKSNSHAEYDLWTKQEPFRRLFARLLLDGDALTHSFVPRQTVSRVWHAHLAGKDSTVWLCGVLTAEIWLQQVFEGRYRNGLDL